MSESKDQEYFADGMTEEILDLLATIPTLKVTGRTSSFQFKGKNEDLRVIAAKLGVAYVLEGSVRKSGDRLRVAAQLIDARDGTHRWSGAYDRDVGDALKMQDEIAAGLVRALQVTVGVDQPRPPPDLGSGEAYDLFLRGRHAFDRFDKAGLESAEGYFQQALAIDPSLVRAAEWLAAAQEFVAEYGLVPPREGYERARASAQRALKLEARSAMAHSLLISIYTTFDWDWAAAAEESERALALEPRNTFVTSGVSDFKKAQGDLDGAARLITAALARDPLFAAWHGVLGMIWYRSDRLAEAEAELHKALEISPSYTRGRRRLGQILLAEGKLDAALSEMRHETPDGGRDLGLAIVYHAMKRTADSDAALAQLTKDRADDRAYQIAEAHAYRAELDQAFAWLDRAYRQKDVELFWIKHDPLLRSLEGDPRFKMFLRRMGLPQ